MDYTAVISVDTLAHQLSTQFYDPAELAYVQGQLVPAAWEACAAWCNRDVFPTLADWAAAEAADLPLRYPRVASPAFLQAVLLLVGHYYLHREAVADNKLAELPMGVYRLLWPQRMALGI